MNNIDFPEDSESSDEDYVPEGVKELPSEEESDGDQEDPLSNDEDDGKTNKKRKKKAGGRKKKKQAKLEENEVKEEEEKEGVKVELSEEDKKKRADDLWASFKKDTGFKTKKPAAEEASTAAKKAEETKISEVKAPTKPVQEKVKITQIFEFAGEEVKVEKEVAADSIEARLYKEKPSGSVAPPKKGVARGSTGGGLKGIGAVLSQIGKKPKVSTLEKSKLDWDKFKKEENIEEELKTHNKGKDGYLDRQDFLQRADLRRFEIEKEYRTIERNKRMNNV